MEEKRLPIFSKRFSQLRKDMTQGEFAEFLGISRPTVGFYENGSRLPDAYVLRQIAEKCHVSADWLLGLSDTRVLDVEIQQICNYTGLSPESVKTLNELNFAWHEPTAALMLIDSILDKGSINNYGQFSWRGAVAEIQVTKVMIQKEEESNRGLRAELPLSEYIKTDEYKKELEESQKRRKQLNEKLAIEANKPIGEVSETIEVRASDIADLFKERALKKIKYAAERAYHNYVIKMVELEFGDYYDSYAEKYSFLPGARSKMRQKGNKTTIDET